MIYLLFSILASSSLLLLFKVFPRWKVHTPSAITVNYAVAGIISWTQVDVTPSGFELWHLSSAGLGVFFMLVFLIMARTARENGVAIASLAAKLSMVLPIGLGIFLFREVVGPLGIIGLVLGFISVFFVSGSLKDSRLGLMPLLLFFGSGLVDLLISLHTKGGFVPDDQQQVLMSSIFGFAFLAGLVLHIKERNFRWQSVWGGLLLGVVNYGSLFFLMGALRSDFKPSAELFPLNNLGIIIFSTIFGILLLRERPSRNTYIGIGLGSAALLLIVNG